MNTETNQTLWIKIGESHEDKLNQGTFAEAFVTDGSARSDWSRIMTGRGLGRFCDQAVLQDGEDIIAAGNRRHA